MEKGEKFTIALDKFRGESVSPAHIPIVLLDTYFSSLKRFIIADTGEKNVEIGISEGSLKTVVTASAAFISVLQADVVAINEGRPASVEARTNYARNLQRYARNNNASIYFADEKNMKLLEITPNTDILKQGGVWVDFEGFVYGKIRAIGGAEPNLHIIDADGNETKISSDEKTLRGLKENVLYSSKLVHFAAKKNLSTNEIAGRKLLSIENMPVFNAAAAAERIKAATREWAGVETDDFMERIRG